MCSSFTLALIIIFVVHYNGIQCLRCYLCHSYEQKSGATVWNETCNVLTPGKQLKACSKLGTHCFTICSMDRIRKLRYIRRGCTSHKNLCTTRFLNQNEVEDSEMQIQCSVCSYDSCNHLNSCDPEWVDYEDEHSSNRKLYTNKNSIVLKRPLKLDQMTARIPINSEKFENKTELFSNGRTFNKTEDNTSLAFGNALRTNENSHILTMSKVTNLTTKRVQVTDYPGQVFADYLNTSEYDYNNTFNSDFYLEWNSSDGIRIRSTVLYVISFILLCTF